VRIKLDTLASRIVGSDGVLF